MLYIFDTSLESRALTLFCTPPCVRILFRLQVDETGLPAGPHSNMEEILIRHSVFDWNWHLSDCISIIGSTTMVCLDPNFANPVVLPVLCPI